MPGRVGGVEKVLGAEKSFGSRDGRGKVLMGAVSIRQIVSLQPTLFLASQRQPDTGIHCLVGKLDHKSNCLISNHIFSICILSSYLPSKTSIM